MTIQERIAKVAYEAYYNTPPSEWDKLKERDKNRWLRVADAVISVDQ